MVWGGLDFFGGDVGGKGYVVGGVCCVVVLDVVVGEVYGEVGVVVLEVQGVVLFVSQNFMVVFEVGEVFFLESYWVGLIGMDGGEDGVLLLFDGLFVVCFGEYQGGLIGNWGIYQVLVQVVGYDLEGVGFVVGCVCLLLGCYMFGVYFCQQVGVGGVNGNYGVVCIGGFKFSVYLLLVDFFKGVVRCEFEMGELYVVVVLVYVYELCFCCICFMYDQVGKWCGVYW